MKASLSEAGFGACELDGHTLDVGLASCRLGILDRFCTGPHALRRPGSESRKVRCAVAKAAELMAHSIAFLVLCEAGRGHQPLGACVLLAARVLPARLSACRKPRGCQSLW